MNWLRAGRNQLAALHDEGLAVVCPREDEVSGRLRQEPSLGRRLPVGGHPCGAPPRILVGWTLIGCDNLDVDLGAVGLDESAIRPLLALGNGFDRAPARQRDVDDGLELDPLLVPLR